jgi:hypothetical protein
VLLLDSYIRDTEIAKPKIAKRRQVTARAQNCGAMPTTMFRCGIFFLSRRRYALRLFGRPSFTCSAALPPWGRE